MKKNEKMGIAIAGAIIGVIAALLVLFGNPTNMGYCIACFLRDTAGGLKLHSAAVVQYVRPEIIGLVLGSFIMAVLKKEWAPKGGSAPFTRFILGFFVMIKEPRTRPMISGRTYCTTAAEWSFRPPAVSRRKQAMQ